MGLAAPRNKRKIAADPRNLTWSSNASSTSIGHKLMTAQGWSEGQSLGSRSTAHLSGGTPKDENAARLAAARVGVIFKDDQLGLGAKLKSRDVEGQRTGMDAFVGLLGRLNAKGQMEEEEVVRKEGERKLERYARGRWGGMLFVPGGVLVGGEEFGTKKEAREREEREAAAAAAAEVKVEDESGAVEETPEEKAKRKEEKRRRKEERRARREAKAATERSHSSSKATSDMEMGDEDKDTSRSTSRSQSKSKSKKRRSAPSPDESISSSASEEAKPKKSKKRKHEDHEAKSSNSTSQSTSAEVASPAAVARPSSPLIRTGRQILRGRNIEAKRRAFQDAKGLDGIFMRAGA